ncbi:AvrE-family type 3 secretion system effector [Pseudomonas vanderleydeniana]|uniref:AvrE-family type 3 secretion system effector n=2 Tax=Pseudomonas vanderleydeniana TaxID=2745495 RepID=A0A9E6TU93_9PSED|nr:AvrE-family type 3 secretion system effector [Pseudomonas vanderleydeniana]
MRSIGQLTQDLRATPRQTSRSNNTTAPAPSRDEQAASAAARQTRQPGSRLQGGAGLGPSLMAGTRQAPGTSQLGSTREIEQAPEASTEASTSSSGQRLERSNAGRFDGRNERIQRQAAADTPGASVQLDAKGAADFQGFKPAAVGELLHDALGRAGQSYQASHSDRNGQDHLLLDQGGHLLHLKQTPSALVVLRSSQAEGTQAGSAPTTPSLELQDNAAQVSHGGQKSNPLQTIGRAHLAHLTGIHQDRDGQPLRLHEQQLYEFDHANAAWRLPEETGHLKFSQLASQGNGKLYGQTGDALVDLTSQDVPHVEVPALKAFSVSADHHAATLSGDDSQTLHLIDLNQQPPRQSAPKTLELNGGQAEPKSIGLSHDRLFVSDTEGRLYSAKRADLQQDSPTLRLMPEEHFHPTGERLGGARQVSGFLPGDQGELHVLLSDKSGQTHSHALDEQNQRLKGGWNLTDALVLDNRRGLPGSEPPTPAATFDLDRLGRVGLSDQRVQSWDSTSQDWKDTGIKDVTQLQRGIDSKAYLLQDGTLRKLDVSPRYNSVSVGSSHNLNQPPRTTQASLGEPLPGLDDRHVTAFAMLNEKQFVALDASDRLTAHHKDGQVSDLSRIDLEGTVASLALDENHNLHALTTEGKLFTMARDDWQASPAELRPEAQWKPVPLPAGRKLESIRTADDNSLSVTLKDSADHSQLQLKGRTWQPLTPRPADHNALSEMFGRIRGDEKTARIPGTGLTARFGANAMGRSGLERSNRASTSEFIRANIFRPGLETPRVLKNIGNHIQHRHHGREGLRPLYESEGPLFKRLELLSHTQQPAAAGQDLKSRIGRLDLGPQGAGLLEDLEAFRGELEDNSLRATRHLGQQHGKSKLLQQKEGLLNIHGELSEPSKRTQLSMKLDNLSQKLNIASSGHDLIKELQGALEHVAPSEQNKTGALLKTLRDNGMQLSHQKADIPLGQRRDASDSLGLTKARVALDVVTLKDLGTLLDKVEMLSPGADNSRQLDQLKKDLGQLRDKQYGEHPVKQMTDMGFTDHANLEASYDGVKAFLNGFKKEDHAVSVNLRAATGSKTQAELADKLKASLKQLEHPDDEITLQRSYGLNLSTPFVSLANKGMGPWPSGSVGGARNYNLSAERADKGITVYLQREGSGSVSGGVGGGKDYWPGFFKSDEVNQYTKVDIGNDRRLTPALRLGVDVTGTATTTQRDGVLFTVPDEGIDRFVDDLFGGNIKPLELMKKGVDHETQKGLRFNFDLNASGTAEFRVGLGLTDKDSTPLSAAARFGVGGTVNVNLLNYTNYSVDHHSNTGQLQESSRNRPRLLNSLGGSLFARAQIAGSNTPASSAATPPSQGVVAPLGGAVTASVDNKTTKRVKFTFKEAESLTSAGLSKLGTSLGKAFKDPASQRELTRLADMNQPEYAGLGAKEKLHRQLQGLEQHFADKPAGNDEQYAALRALKRAGVQQQAAEARHSMLDGGRIESSYTNLSRLNEQSAVSKVMSLVSPLHSTSNAERVSALLDHDPTLKALVKDMQNTPGTLARVRLELKDHVQDRIDEGSRSGNLSQKELAALLSDRDNMRVKAITVYQSVSQPESFTSPLPLVSYSSSASLNVNKTLGKINFSYGQDQDTPKSYFLDGELSRPGQPLKSAVGALKKDGLELKS